MGKIEIMVIIIVITTKVRLMAMKPDNLTWSGGGGVERLNTAGRGWGSSAPADTGDESGTVPAGRDDSVECKWTWAYCISLALRVP